MTTLTHLGTRIQEVRKQRGMKQQDLAQKAGCGRSAVSNIERGISIGTDKLTAITEALDSELIIIEREKINQTLKELLGL